MTYFNLRKREKPEPEPETTKEEPDETFDGPEEEPEQTVAASPTSWGWALWYGILGPGRWIAARFGMGAAWGVHVVAAWAVLYYGSWTAVGVVLVWLLAVLLFTPREFLDRAAAAIERRSKQSPADESEASEPTTGETSEQPDPQDVLGLVRDLIGSDRGILLTALRGPLHAADTRAVREALTAAGIGVRPGVRTAAGNGPGVHRDDLPPLSPTLTEPPGEGVAAGQDANTNTNNKLRVHSREGMTIINDPADRHRTHILNRP